MKVNFDNYQNEIEILKKLNLSETEAKVYIVLLQLGDLTPWEISQASGIYRSNVYNALNKLSKQGLVSTIEKDKKKLFEAANPRILLRVIERNKEETEKIIPHLSALKRFSNESKAQVYEGTKAFMELLYNFLDYEEPILVYGIPKIAPAILKRYINQFHEKRIALKIKMLHIYNHNARDRIKYLNSLPFTEARWLPTKLDSQVSTNICGNEVVLSLWQERVWSVRVINEEIAKAYKKYFYLLWSLAKLDK